MAKIENNTTTKCWQRFQKKKKKLDHSYTADGKVTWYSLSINWFGRFF